MDGGGGGRGRGPSWEGVGERSVRGNPLVINKKGSSKISEGIPKTKHFHHSDRFINNSIDLFKYF